VVGLRLLRLVLGALVALAGIIVFLQGVHVITGSSMTGSAFWAVVGAVAIVAGAGLLYWGSRVPS
jgi:hypothetical protein